MRDSPKKSENIEIRVPHGMKSDFMARCRGEGRSASDVLRDFMQAYLAAEALPEESRTGWSERAPAHDRLQ